MSKRSRRFLAGFLAGLSMGGGFGLGAVSDGARWPIVLTIVLVVAMVLGIAAATVRTQTFVQVANSSQHVPSEETLKRGISAFQIDGGRAPKIGEKPPRKYWDVGP